MQRYRHYRFDLPIKPQFFYPVRHHSSEGAGQVRPAAVLERIYAFFNPVIVHAQRICPVETMIKISAVAAQTTAFKILAAAFTALLPYKGNALAAALAYSVYVNAADFFAAQKTIYTLGIKQVQKTLPGLL